MGEDGGSRTAGRSGGSEKQSDPGYILKYTQYDVPMYCIRNMR